MFYKFMLLQIVNAAFDTGSAEWVLSRYTTDSQCWTTRDCSTRPDYEPKCCFQIQVQNDASVTPDENPLLKELRDMGAKIKVEDGANGQCFSTLDVFYKYHDTATVYNDYRRLSERIPDLVVKASCPDYDPFSPLGILINVFVEDDSRYCNYTSDCSGIFDQHGLTGYCYQVNALQPEITERSYTATEQVLYAAYESGQFPYFSSHESIGLCIHTSYLDRLTHQTTEDGEKVTFRIYPARTGLQYEAIKGPDERPEELNPARVNFDFQIYCETDANCIDEEGLSGGRCYTFSVIQDASSTDLQWLKDLFKPISIPITKEDEPISLCAFYDEFESMAGFTTEGEPNMSNNRVTFYLEPELVPGLQYQAIKANLPGLQYEAIRANSKWLYAVYAFAPLVIYY